MELFFPIVLDGANGTELQKRGYDGSMCTEAWVLENPEVMRQLQRDYAAAGSDVVYAPTFGANRVKLEENGFFNQVGQFNRDLVRVSKEAVGNRAMIAGDITSTGKFLEPLGDLSFDELYEIYHEQAEALEEAGVDMYAIETIMTVPDARAALLAVRDVSDKPVLVSFTCDAGGRTMTGTDVCAALVIMQSMGADAFGLNCSTGPAEMLEQFRRLGEYAEVPLAVKPNAGMPKIRNGETVYDCGPDEFAEYTDSFIEAGAVLFGGCCGTGPEHIQKLKAALENFDTHRSLPGSQNESRRGRDGKIVCATEKDVFVFDPGVQAERVLPCGAGLEDAINAENRRGSAVIAVGINSEEDLDEFAAAQYAIRRPLCIVCEDAKLLDRALALYQGRAMYAGSLADEELLPLAKKYGMIY
ncbi:MAG: homocysteine S-methyltransferase family protein [Mogibacterium sp.]|nr:homocysteine S-methyltransferase family protein [Mogibacterium sp.]